MPYIKQAIRKELIGYESKEIGYPETPGELNYVLTRIIQRYLSTFGGLQYTSIALVTGVLENIKQEFYRRMAAPYEDQRMKENGDVFDLPCS